MNKVKKLLAILFAICLSSGSFAATFKAGEEVIISETVNDNLYAAGNTISINAVVHGDLTSAGNSVSINDTVMEDLILAGNDILVNAYIGDDARIFGNNIKILNSIDGDLIAFGATVQIHKDVVINGDLIISGGHCIISGTVNGSVKAYGSKVFLEGSVSEDLLVKAESLKIGGSVYGSSELVAQKIDLQGSAAFHDDVEYWHKDGELDFGGSMVNGRATFNEELSTFDDDVKWEYLGLGFIVFWILFTLYAFLTIILLVLLFHKTFEQAGEQINTSFIRNFGYGVLYFIGLPMLALFFMIIVIGIPIGLALLAVFFFSILFSYSISSVVLAFGFVKHNNKDWNKWQIMLAAAVIMLVLKLISIIPFIGWLIAMVAIATAFGALVVHCVRGKDEEERLM